MNPQDNTSRYIICTLQTQQARYEESLRRGQADKCAKLESFIQSLHNWTF